jgi:hypothetical protein
MSMPSLKVKLSVVSRKKIDMGLEFFFLLYFGFCSFALFFCGRHSQKISRDKEGEVENCRAKYQPATTTTAACMGLADQSTIHIFINKQRKKESQSFLAFNLTSSNYRTEDMSEQQERE